MEKRRAGVGYLEPGDSLEEIVSYLRTDPNGVSREELDEIVDFIASRRSDDSSDGGGTDRLRGG